MECALNSSRSQTRLEAIERRYLFSGLTCELDTSPTILQEEISLVVNQAAA